MNKIVVEDGATLTINGAIACTNAENLIIKDGGQLLHDNKGVMATIEKEIQGYGSTGDGWYTVSSPLVGNVELSFKDFWVTTNAPSDWHIGLACFLYAVPTIIGGGMVFFKELGKILKAKGFKVCKIVFNIFRVLS